MKFSTIAPLAFGLGASAAAIETRQTTKCCFGITVAGGVSGPLGQLSDGQNRVGPGYTASTFCIKDGAITDSTGRGCIITPQASQFQCDAGKTPSPGFSITGNGSILANGTSTFYACPATSYGVYNIYTAPVAGQTACKTVTLSSSNGTCANSAASSSKASSAAATSSKASSASSSKVSSASSSKVSSASSVRTSSASSVASATATTSSKVSSLSSVKVSSVSSVASATSSKASSVASSSSVRSSSASSVAPVATTSSKASSASSSSSVRSSSASSVAPVATTSSKASSASSSISVRTSSASSTSSVKTSSASSVAPVVTSSSVKPSSSSAAAPVTVTVTSFVTITPACSTSLSSSRPASVISVTSSGSKAASSSATSSKPASASSSTRAATSTIVTSVKTSSSASSVKATTSTSAAATKASSSSASSKASSSAAASSTACPANLNGPYQYPHLIIPVNSSAPTTAYGTQYFGTITPTVSSIFNFDIPASYAGKTCSLVFLFPLQSQLTTSSFTQSGAGGLDFKQLKSPATNATDYANAPAVAADLGVVAAAPGNSYTIASGACAAGQTVSYEISATGSYALHYFQDYNPSPLGLYIREC